MEESRLRRLAAIMFTDMVGYTALGQRNESLSLTLVEDQRKLIRPILRKYFGKEIKTIGDAFLVEFRSALEAVECAYHIQKAIKEFNNAASSDEQRLHLRIGIHVGDVLELDGDISGDAVNVASRIEALAEDGGVCLTRQVYDHIQNKFELPISSIGSKTLKNISSPIQVFKIVMPWEEQRKAPKFDSRRIAILPFSNISPDPNDEYFADGMTEELISAMSKIKGLKVIARTSVMAFKKKEKKIDEIAKDLEVGTILEGSVRKAGDRLRITVQLIDSETSDHLWSESYDREMKDVFAVQGEIAQTVADSLKIRLLDETKEKIEKIVTKNSEAYALYLKGIYYALNEYTEEAGVRKGIKCLEKAIELDPTFSLAYAWLADSYASLSLAYSKYEELPKAERAASRALELDPDMAFAHVALSGILYSKRDFGGAERELRRALELDPNVPEGHGYLFYTLTALGRTGEAAKEAEKALEQDPLAEFAIQVMSDSLINRREYARALELMIKVRDYGRDNPWFFWRRGWCYLHTSRFDEAISEFEKRELEAHTHPHSSKFPLAIAYAMSGKKEQAKMILKELETKGTVPTWDSAPIYAALGESEQTLKFLEKALERKESHTLTDTTDGYAGPLYDYLRNDPRFIAIMKKAVPLLGQST